MGPLERRVRARRRNMDWVGWYTLVALNFGFYMLGRKDERGHKGWKNTVAAFAIGAIWPLAAGYGVYLKHWKAA